MPKRSRRGALPDPATRNFQAGLAALQQHPMFAPLAWHAHVGRHADSRCPPKGWAIVTSRGYIYVHPTRLAEPEEWTYVLAHCLLHLGLGHIQPRDRFRDWNAACDCVVTRFLGDLKLGRPPEPWRDVEMLSAQSEEKLYQRFGLEGIPPEWRGLGTGAPEAPDMLLEPAVHVSRRWDTDWVAEFGHGLTQAVTSAVRVAAGEEPYLGAHARSLSAAVSAYRWFINSYPLLGALASSFRLIEDPALCARLQISIAAVDAELQEVFINPAAGLDERECRFVMAHELLHVGLRHQARRQGRDPFLWNAACDYVINAWLMEMQLGDLPAVGALYDPELKGLSAEAIYDRIVTDLRRNRKLATLRGVGLGDILERGRPDWWESGDGVGLDDFYRRCLGQGLVYHDAAGRGLLPAGLVEEINALTQPPIPWDVELAQWFDEHFLPLEKVRSYARLSRRQAASPDIPRPRWITAPDAEEGRTFAVVLDPSGSMDRQLLAKALGSIASYSLARDVALVRVVFCDAAAYDQGYLRPEDIAGRVKVRGRGGTVLQPGIELLLKAEDFPATGPILIIADGYCDRLQVLREHAFLIPRSHHLPFVPRGKVFYLD